eukprot:3510520-Rhodomonas_salina.1
MSGTDIAYGPALLALLQPHAGTAFPLTHGEIKCLSCTLCTAMRVFHFDPAMSSPDSEPPYAKSGTEIGMVLRPGAVRCVECGPRALAEKLSGGRRYANISCGYWSGESRYWNIENSNSCNDASGA